MKAAIVHQPGQTPVYGDFPDPTPSQGMNRIRVTAAALSHLVKGRASGRHYSSSSQFPFVVGVDGVGRLDDGRRVYFILPKPPLGAMAEQTVVREEQCLPLPDDLDDIAAAALANPGMSCWAAFTERARLVAGETVLINGATGTAGRLAIQVARHLGAKKIIATGRNPEALQAVAALGADVIIPLVEDAVAMEKSFREQFAGRVDVVLDYLWGKSAQHILAAAEGTGEDGQPLRYVEVGAVSGPEIALPASLLRSTPISLMGSGLGSVSHERLLHVLGDLFRAAAPGGFKVACHPVPLSQVEQVWPIDDPRHRTVFTIA